MAFMWILNLLFGVATTLPIIRAQSVHDPPGQPLRKGSPGTFEVIGNSLVSGQQLFLGNPDAVYIIDKVENNPAQINGHPAWASEWKLGHNEQRAMDVMTNTFCAGGNVLGNGTWINVGGNQAVTYGGAEAPRQDGGPPYDDPDGRQSIRLLNPCTDGRCDWRMSPHSSDQRWYPTLETLEDGSIIIMGGCRWGGYVNDQFQDNPTYEFFPPRGNGTPIHSPILGRTLPANLYPLVWLLPSGKLLIQSNWETAILDYKTNQEVRIDNIPGAVRVYPASGGSIMLPLTPKNNYTATVMFCGGVNVATDRWNSKDFIPILQAPSRSCVKISPDISGSYTHDDELPEGRSMLNLIHLPDGTILGLNGAAIGTAGYGNTSWTVGQSFADQPVLTPVVFRKSAEVGHRWTKDGFSASTIPRMYHSSATLLPDGSVLVSGSNPNSDYRTGVPYPTEYRTEVFYPSYYHKRRPEPKGIPTSLGYGGPRFDIRLSLEDLLGNIANVDKTSVILIRTGFSTHSMNMGQRFLELRTTWTAFQNNGSAVVHVSQLPPNAALFAPGPALLFVVVDGVPSVGVQVMIGSGRIENQYVDQPTDLPASRLVTAVDKAKSDEESGSDRTTKGTTVVLLAAIVLALV
ncbi:hypothetical protein CC2G_012291 [Coprinopsis cinerea AmutBmut pab1-1]|nr:hypothetical protein CC2G_012291 [Coprinopsis cinerea AmutBmut pab1-1]